jgi:hypothetical protein
MQIEIRSNRVFGPECGVDQVKECSEALGVGEELYAGFNGKAAGGEVDVPGPGGCAGGSLEEVRRPGLALGVLGRVVGELASESGNSFIVGEHVARNESFERPQLEVSDVVGVSLNSEGSSA